MEGKKLMTVEGGEPVKVPVPEVGAEEQVIGKDRWEFIHKLKAAGQSVSQIARITGTDRKTVRSCLARSHWHPYRREPRGNTLLGPYAAWLEQRAAQVGYSARILLQELCRDHGYKGSYDTVRNAVRPLRAQATVASLTQIRFETGPGEQAQVDWGQARVLLGGEPAEVHIFVMTLGYSRRGWAEGFFNERIDSLLSAHEHAFEHFGGVCVELLYDRMRTVVLGNVDGRPRWNPKFEAFAKHWGFHPRVCRPYRAQTKGKVESGVKYVKRNFLPGRVFQDLEDFNAQLRAWIAEVADVRVHGTTHQRPIDRFADEASALTLTRGHPSFLQAMVRDRIVAEDWLVAIDANRYSVPWKLIGKTVQVVRAGECWRITYRGELVAEHPVLAGRHQLSVLPEHGPGASARNVRRRFADPTPAPSDALPLADDAVEVRDLTVYDQMLEAA
jgi:transposase